MSYRLGFDVGGTLADILLVREDTGETFREKTASTPTDDHGQRAGGDRAARANVNRGPVTVTHTSEGFAGRLRPGSRPAVLAIDMMAAYYTEGSPFCLPSRSSLAGAAEVLYAARRAGVPVLHTVVTYSPQDLENLVFLRKVPALRQLTGDNPMGRLMPEVAPQEGEPVLVKQQASAFFGTDLTERLAALNVDTVVITGVSTSGCVRATAVDAVARNLVAVVVQDAVGDRTEEVGVASLTDLQTKYAEVVDLATAVGYLEAGV